MPFIFNYSNLTDVVSAGEVTKDSVEELAGWCGGVPVKEIDPFDENKTYAAINVPTLNGVERAREGEHFIVRDWDESFKVVPRDEFFVDFEKMTDGR